MRAISVVPVPINRRELAVAACVDDMRITGRVGRGVCAGVMCI